MSLPSAFATVLFLAATLPNLAYAQPTFTVDRVVGSGRTLKIDYFATLDPTCRSIGPITINVFDGSHAREVQVAQGHEYPNFASFNSCARCNTQRLPATQLLYSVAPGYIGEDSCTIEAVGPYGAAQRWL